MWCMARASDPCGVLSGSRIAGGGLDYPRGTGGHPESSGDPTTPTLLASMSLAHHFGGALRLYIGVTTVGGRGGLRSRCRGSTAVLRNGFTLTHDTYLEVRLSLSFYFFTHPSGDVNTLVLLVHEFCEVVVMLLFDYWCCACTAQATDVGNRPSPCAECKL